MIERERVPVWSGGRAIIAAPLKIAAVTGTRPEGYDDEAFTAEATRSILAGFSRFQMAERVALHRSDRSFYMDFNPWCGEDETLFLSVELYSPFHCRKPVHRNAPNPLVGPWTERDRLFKEAAAALEEAVARCTGDPDGGDGLDPVDDSIAVVSWESLGLALAARREGAGAAVKSGPLSRAWTLDTDSTEGSSLVFHFPAPLDGYVGEVGKVTGSLELAEGYFLSGSRGWFEADPASVTMGESDLDDALRGTSYLDVKRFPASRFTIRSVSCDGMAIQFGTGTRAALEGTFEMKGVSIPLALTAEFEPRESVEGETRLVMDGTFTIPLEPFDLEGPDGPPEASQSLMFALRFVHVPATEP
jgi:polyisoprenoid-binding protein YceI